MDIHNKMIFWVFSGRSPENTRVRSRPPIMIYFDRTERAANGAQARADDFSIAAPLSSVEFAVKKVL